MDLPPLTETYIPNFPERPLFMERLVTALKTHSIKFSGRDFVTVSLRGRKRMVIGAVLYTDVEKGHRAVKYSVSMYSGDLPTLESPSKYFDTTEEVTQEIIGTGR
jgi:hypothetical protein